MAVQRRLVEKATARLTTKTRSNDEEITTFAPGTFVMIKKVVNRKGDFARTMNEGPFEVIRQDGNKISLYDY